MKTLKIIQTILNSYKSRSWNVLIVFIISYIIMGFVVIFIVGAFHPYVSTRGSTDLLECRYTVSLNTAQPYEYFERFYENDQIRNNRHFEMQARCKDYESFLTVCTVVSENHEVILTQLLSGRLHFTEEETEKARAAAIVTPDLGRVGSVINTELFGELEVVGVMDDIRTGIIYVPYSLCLEKQINFHSFSFVVPSRLNYSQIRDLENFVRSDINVVYFQGPAPTLSTIRNSFWATLPEFIFIILITVIMLLFFAQYMAVKNKRIYALFCVLGESKAGIMYLMLLERAFIALISMSVASVLHYILKNRLHNIMKLPNCNMIFIDYILVAVSFCMITLLVFIPYGIHFVRSRQTVLLKQSD